MGHGIARKPRIRDAGRHERCDRKRREFPARPQSQRTARRLVTATVVAFGGLIAVAAIVLTLQVPDQQGGAPTSKRSALPPVLFDSPVMAGLPPPGPSTRVPVNQVDRFTGKLITASSPTIPYKGCVVAFCCPHSTGYRGGWDRLSEAEKDTYVREFFK